VHNEHVIMKQFGPFRLYWKWAGIGGLFLQEAKPLIYNMIGKWQYNVHVHIYKRQSFRRLMRINNKYVPLSEEELEIMEEERKATESGGKKGRNVQIFKFHSSIVQVINRGLSLSCYLVSKKVFVGLQKDSNKTEIAIVGHKMERCNVGSEVDIINWFLYEQFHLNVEDEIIVSSCDLHYCFMLPKFGNRSTSTVVRDDLS
jgi:hypothetical protein